MKNAAIIAERYARAAAAAIPDNAALEAALQGIDDFAAVQKEHPDAIRTLDNPALPSAQRRAAFGALLDRISATEEASQLLKLLYDRGRIALVSEVAEALRAKLDVRLNRVRAKVWSARDLQPEQRERVRAGLEKHSGKSVELELDTDPDLLAGVVVKLDGIVMDGSLRSRLERIEAALLAEETH